MPGRGVRVEPGDGRLLEYVTPETGLGKKGQT